MPFFDDFANSFASSFGAITKLPSKTERENIRSETRHREGEERRAEEMQPYNIEQAQAATTQALSAAGYNDALTRKIETELTPEALDRVARAAEADIALTGAQTEEAYQRAAAEEIENQNLRLGKQTRIIDWFRRYHPGMSDEDIQKVMGGEMLPPPSTGTPGAAIPETTAPGEEEPEAPTPAPDEDVSTAAGGEVPYLAGTGGETAEVPGAEPLSGTPSAGVMEHITGRRGDAGRRGAIPDNLAAAPVTGRTLQDYLAMTRQELAQLPPEEYNRFVDMYEAAGNPAYTTPARTPTARPTTAAPAPAAAPTARVPQPRPAAGAPAPPAPIDPRLPRRHPGYPARTPQPRPEYTEQQAGYETARVPQPRPSAGMYIGPAGTVPPNQMPEAMGTGMAIQENVRGTDVSAARDIQRGARPPSDVALARDIQGIRGEAQVARAQGLRGEVIEAQAGTRNKPLNERTRSMLEAASAATGLQVRVTSGAQPSSGSERTGSHRHDTEIGSADLQLIDPNKNNKVLSFENAEDRGQIVAFLRAAKENGATGFGAGLDYMGPTTLHVGFGEPAIWGAGGKSANAPEWLVAGLTGAPQGAIPSSGGRPRVTGNQVFDALGTRLPFMQSAILAGNIQQESSGNPLAHNVKEGAHGILQWRDSRWQALQDFAASDPNNPRDPNDLQTQIDFLIKEGESLGSAQDRAAWSKFMAAKTPEEANAALKGFIRYGDQSQGQRLKYGQELLSGVTGEGPATTGSVELRGPSGSARALRGTGLDRAVLQTTTLTAAKAGLNNAVANAGLTGPTPAITDQGRETNKRQYLMGANAASPQAMADIRQTVQGMAGDTMTEAELNSAVLAQSYDYALNVEGDEKLAQSIAGQIMQYYRGRHNQYMSFAKMLAEEGRLDEAGQMAAKAYAQIPNNQEATFSQNQDGTFSVTTKDLQGNLITEQIMTPEQMYAGIMGWSPIEFDRAIMRAAGETPPSRAYEAYSRASAGIPETGAPAGTPPGSVGTQNLMEQTVGEMRGATRVPVGGEAPPVPDVAAMTTKEAPLALKQSEISAKRRDELRAATFGTPFTAAQRQEIDAQLTDIAAKMPDQMASIASLFPDQPQKINTVIYGIQQMNPNVPIQTIIGDLAVMAQGSNNFDLVAQTSETRSTQVPDSVVLNMPNQIFSMIWNPLMRKEGAVTGQPSTVARDLDTEAEKVEAQRAADVARGRLTPTYNPRGAGATQPYRAGQEYVPSFLQTQQPAFNPRRQAIPQSTTPPSGYVNRRGMR